MMKSLPGAVVLLLSAGLVAGCVADTTAEETPVEPVDDGTSLERVDLRAELRTLVAEVSADHGGRVGLALATGDEVVHVGLTGTSFAWSTVKVPIAVAAEREGVATEALIEASISNSDNAAAYQLARAVDLELGDLDFVPELEPLPGETFWPLTEQAQFAADLPCVDTEGATYAAMADIVDWQRYGLANIDGAHFKGGWGLDAPQVYGVRQIGTVPAGDGHIGVAMIAYPDDANHDTGTDILDALSLGLAELIDAGDVAPTAICSL
ncbi:hypothetical protein [Corynebacterium sp.]|uniref:hypothetical protein n=1 Tax=Corynebacterium sp. TaxID=1720 RepID=UPI0026DFAE49|nr:hypothetical protein [Corynebacterium sp.]MDO5512846.1 hypothetical protein [Corynebacterium sp.]